jgi:hypothetical protein
LEKMRDKEIVGLWEAYLQVHQPKEEVEQLDEFLGSGAQKFVDDATKKGGDILRKIPGVAKVLSPVRPGPGTVTADQQKANIKKNVPLKNSFDPFDAILEHLVAEGYADTNESALAIMANMSEEWRESIVEGRSDRPLGYMHPFARGVKQPKGKKTDEEHGQDTQGNITGKYKVKGV